MRHSAAPCCDSRPPPPPTKGWKQSDGAGKWAQLAQSDGSPGGDAPDEQKESADPLRPGGIGAVHEQAGGGDGVEISVRDWKSSQLEGV